ncbi:MULTISPECIES: glycoside hydrolase family 2 protein [unclassified Oceanispirochaeta]|nr:MULTISPECIES: sugar-binding domain-containing protein [unclassified Oceanispirochaeta]MBF9015815.1 hypothetical protein [Oceanispirochaeta sp. M2]NPD72278.1 hypothetical protein [Oceanispirochaeta sp. M1]RDG32371.1 hypothetical protein DV872_09215 [Oceanispirochaeta sp. M1]
MQNNQIKWRRIKERMETPWANKIDINNPLGEYPRPQFVRPDWLSLNGIWDYVVKEDGNDDLEDYDGEILVPFAIETAASGVGKPLHPNETLRYRKKFEIPENWKEKRIKLNFEAVDWHCICRINGIEAGVHKGGYIPFFFDISDLIVDGVNEMTLDVKDPTDSGHQQKGKQTLKPKGCFYKATSGIWQSVWLEPVPEENHILKMKLTPQVDSSSLTANITTVTKSSVRLTIISEGKKISQLIAESGKDLVLPISDPRLWSPVDPYLYDLKVELISSENVIDSVESYFALRKISTAPGYKGRHFIYLNDTAIFLHGPLDQGYWPESGMTAPSEEAIIFDLEKTKALGFNMVRKHIKIESRRWYYHADRLGLAVIQDMVSGGNNYVSPLGDALRYTVGKHYRDTSKQYKKSVGRSSPDNRAGFEEELTEMIEHLYNTPSLLIWCPFNEAWGQYDALRISDMVGEKDPSRLIDHASGWYDQGRSDFESQHSYSAKLPGPGKNDDRVYLLSEYGGINLNIPGHLWDENKKFGYRSFKSKKSLEQAYVKLMRQSLNPLIEKGLGGAVYTQISDVEIESNGFYTYDRRVLKIDEAVVYESNKEIYEAFRSLNKK